MSAPATPTRVQTVWRVPRNHTATNCKGGGGCDGRGGDDGCPHALRFHSFDAALDALDAWVRKRVELPGDPLRLSPSWGPRFCDWGWDDKYGQPAWEWRIHDCTITRHAEAIEVKGTLDVRVMGRRTVRTYAEVDGEQIAVGWHKTVCVVEDWAPWCGQDTIAKGTDERRVCGWTIEPEAMTIQWGDEPGNGRP